MRSVLLGILTLVFVLSQAVTSFAQDTPAGTDVTKAQIQAALQKALAERITDQTLAFQDVGKAIVSIGFVIRRPPDSTGKPLGNIGGPLIHEKVTEIYYVTAGSGEQVTGGRILDGKDQSGGAIGPGIRGTKMEGGRVSNMVAGDVLIIPAGTVHMWKSVGPQGVDYLIFRVDPEKLTTRPKTE